MTRIYHGLKDDRNTSKDCQGQRCVKANVMFFDNWNFGWLVSRSRFSFSSLLVVLFLRIIREFTRLPQNEAHISWSEWGITYIAVCLGETKNEGGKLKFDSVTLSHWTHSVIFCLAVGKPLRELSQKKKLFTELCTTSSTGDDWGGRADL